MPKMLGTAVPQRNRPRGPSENSSSDLRIAGAMLSLELRAQPLRLRHARRTIQSVRRKLVVMAAAAFRHMLEHDRLANGFSVRQVAWRLGISRAEYHELVAGER
jgi:hypothetical protein